MNNSIRPRRLFVSGGSQLSKNAAVLWRELGRLLAHKNGPVVITGGLGRLQGAPNSVMAEKMILEGLLQGLGENGIPVDQRVETFVPDANRDAHKDFRIKAGRIVALTKRNPQSRRFSMVHSADIVATIEGEIGTRSVLDVALAIGRPVFPLPFEGDFRKKGGSLPSPPFDFGTHSIFGYTDDLDDLRRRLQEVIPIVCGKPQNLDPG